LKKPIEDAADAAAKPADPHNHKDPARLAFDFNALRADPVVYLRTKAISFFEDLKHDPVGTLKGQPVTTAVLGGISTALIGLIGAFVTLFSPKPKVVKKKASEATESVKGKGKEIADKAKAATTSTVEPVDTTTTKKRVTVVQTKTEIQPAPAL